MMRYVFKIYLLLYTLVLILPLRQAATAIFPNATHPDHKGKCYHPGPPSTILNVGETKRHPTDCAKLYCAKGFTVHYAGCGTYSPPSECWTIAGDPSKPHPYCCPEVFC